MLTQDFFKKFRSVTRELIARLEAMSASEGTAPEVQRKKIALLKTEAGLSTEEARQFLYFVMYEPDETGVQIYA